MNDKPDLEETCGENPGVLRCSRKGHPVVANNNHKIKSLALDIIYDHFQAKHAKLVLIVLFVYKCALLKYSIRTESL